MEHLGSTPILLGFMLLNICVVCICKFYFARCIICPSSIQGIYDNTSFQSFIDK